MGVVLMSWLVIYDWNSWRRCASKLIKVIFTFFAFVIVTSRGEWLWMWIGQKEISISLCRWFQLLAQPTYSFYSLAKKLFKISEKNCLFWIKNCFFLITNFFLIFFSLMIKFFKFRIKFSAFRRYNEPK